MELNKIHNIDCLEFMKTLPDKCIDLVLTDPPYGITKAEWDKVPQKEYFDEIFRISKKQIIFGGQFFDLPKREGWMIWCKKPFFKTTNEAELLWSNCENKTKVYEFVSAGNVEGWINGTFKPDYKKQKKIFTSEKSLKFIQFLIETYSNDGEIILDPFGGSGIIGVACKNLGRNYILIEKESEYIDIINKRLPPPKDRE